MIRLAARPRRTRRGGLEPLTPRRKWAAITFGTLLFAPAFWSMLLGLVSLAADDSTVADTTAAAAVALGLAIIPFVFVVLAFASAHPTAPAAVVRAMGFSLAVGIPVSAVAADGVTGLLAGVGAGGIVALRADALHSWRSRAVAVAVASVYAYVLARVAAPAVLMAGPVFPLTAIGLADHWAERRAARDGGPTHGAGRQSEERQP